MNGLIIAVILLAVIALAVLLVNNKLKRSVKNQASAREAVAGLRQQVFETDPSKADIKEFAGSHEVWGVVMEMGYPEAVVTIVALIDGNASLYFSNGGGVIGGVGHDNVRKAAREMSFVADRFVDDSTPTTEFPQPVKGETIFYILTKKGKFMKRALENDLGEQRHAFSPLFYAGQEVITQLRLVTNDFK
jgi:hypothetical protein